MLCVSLRLPRGVADLEFELLGRSASLLSLQLRCIRHSGAPLGAMESFQSAVTSTGYLGCQHSPVVSVLMEPQWRFWLSARTCLGIASGRLAKAMGRSAVEGEFGRIPALMRATLNGGRYVYVAEAVG